jgi:sec-independent protein translocase protein TatB
MFDFDFEKLIIFGIVALVVIPPKDLPRVLRAVGQAIAKMRRMAAEFQGQFAEAMREAELDGVKNELANVKKELSAFERSAKDAAFDPAMAVRQEIAHAVEAPKEVRLSAIALDDGPHAERAPAAAVASAPLAPAAEPEPVAAGANANAEPPAAAATVAKDAAE